MSIVANSELRFLLSKGLKVITLNFIEMELKHFVNADAKMKDGCCVVWPEYLYLCVSI